MLQWPRSPSKETAIRPTVSVRPVAAHAAPVASLGGTAVDRLEHLSDEQYGRLIKQSLLRTGDMEHAPAEARPNRP